VLVHASLRPSPHSLTDIARRFDVDLSQEKLPLGGIVGVTNIVDCVTTHPSPWFEGKFGFILDRSRELPFVTWKGSLGLRFATNSLIDALGNVF
jgi:hypothetical protein